MSSSEQDQESVGATASSSEHDEQPERSCSTSPVSDAASGTVRSSVEREEREASNSSQQSNDSTIYERYGLSGNEMVSNLLVKVEKEFSEICLNEDIFKLAVQSYLDRLIDFVTLGVAFSVYREVKMGAYTAAVVRMEQPENKIELPTTDIFAEYYDKKRKSVCGKCTKMVLASRFAGHLEICMGIKKGRTVNIRTRNEKPATATSSRDQDSPTFDESLPSSDEDNDDADWSCTGEKRKKKRDRNGSKKIKGTPTKKTEIDSNDLMELEEVDIEGEPDEVIYGEEEEEAENDLFSLSEFFVDDSSQSYTTENSLGFRSNTSSDTETKQEQSSPSPTSSS